MTEENLKNLPLQDLRNELERSIRELIILNDAANDGLDADQYSDKRKEISLLFFLIEAKKEARSFPVN